MLLAEQPSSKWEEESILPAAVMANAVTHHLAPDAARFENTLAQIGMVSGRFRHENADASHISMIPEDAPGIAEFRESARNLAEQPGGLPWLFIALDQLTTDRVADQRLIEELVDVVLAQPDNLGKDIALLVAMADFNLERPGGAEIISRRQFRLRSQMIWFDSPVFRVYRELHGAPAQALGDEWVELRKEVATPGKLRPWLARMLGHAAEQDDSEVPSAVLSKWIECLEAEGRPVEFLNIWYRATAE